MSEITHPTDPNRNGAGQFVRGNQASPGRAKRGEEAAMLAAIDRACPPEEVEKLLVEAMKAARKFESWKGLLTVAQFVVGYQIGTPIQRSMTASTKLESIMNRLGEMDDGEFAEVEQAMRNG